MVCVLKHVCVHEDVSATLSNAKLCDCHGTFDS